MATHACLSNPGRLERIASLVRLIPAMRDPAELVRNCASDLHQQTAAARPKRKMGEVKRAPSSSRLLRPRSCHPIFSPWCDRPGTKDIYVVTVPRCLCWAFHQTFRSSIQYGPANFLSRASPSHNRLAPVFYNDPEGTRRTSSSVTLMIMCCRRGHRQSLWNLTVGSCSGD